MDKFESLRNKVVLITGSSRGIGKKISEGFIENGAFVIGISKNKNDKNIIKHSNYVHYKCDFRNHKNLLRVVHIIEDNHKRIDVLINNAGVTIENTKSIKKNLSIFEQTININLKSAYIFSMMVANKMKISKSGGTIINISSIGGELGFPNNPSYQTSKSGLNGITRSFARDYGKYNINCNSVLPGYFKTEMNKKSLSNIKKRKQRENLTMLGRWGELNELVGTVLFLSSKNAKYITGQKIVIDGGISSKGL